jgi:hypothetical protein
MREFAGPLRAPGVASQHEITTVDKARNQEALADTARHERRTRVPDIAPLPELITERKAAERLGVSIDTLRRERRRGRVG